MVDGWGPQGNPYLALTAAARGSNMHVLKTAISQAAPAEMRVFGGKELAVAKSKTRMVELELQLATMAALGQAAARRMRAHVRVRKKLGDCE